MKKGKNDLFYVKQITEDIERVETYIAGVSFENYSKNEELIDATMFRLVQIGENSKNLSDGFKNKYPEIPWEDILRFYNRIVYDYGPMDYTIVYRVLTEELHQVYCVLIKETANDRG
ncbi:MAG: hypothetical protein BWZ03_00527 [bacterium ADurb.BinA186]|jgi:uncharacterized protein with HEPN domain|nr:MAG: hypothetical protein BWZ03_00527 [bacterium ADurb.BinA186]